MNAENELNLWILFQMKIYEKKSLSISNELLFHNFFVSPKDFRIKLFTEVLQVLQVLTNTFKLVCLKASLFKLAWLSLFKTL